MEQVKRYRLIKKIETPQITIPEGNVFIQHCNEPDCAYVCGNYTLHPSYVEKAPSWFELIPEPLPDGSVKEERVFQTLWYGSGKEVSFVFDNPVNKKDGELIESAIRNILNPSPSNTEQPSTAKEYTPFTDLSNFVKSLNGAQKSMWEKVCEEIESQKKESEEKAFNAAREEWVGHNGVEDKYKDYGDYRKSLTENAETPTPSPLPLFTEHNNALDMAISIVQSNKDTMNYGNKATRNPETLCDQIINSLIRAKQYNPNASPKN